MTPDHSALIERLEAGFLSSNPHHSEVYQTNTLLAEAAAALRDLTEWRDIATAPRDGTWVQAWREPPKFTGPRWEPLIYIRWDDEEESWVWPCDTFEVFTVRGRELADMGIEDGDYFSASDFSHWLPLPSAPNQAKEAGE